jgi:hypothetical protein
MAANQKERLELEIKAAMPAPPQTISANAVERDAHDALRFWDDRYEPSELEGQPVPGLSGCDLDPEMRGDIKFLADEVRDVGMKLLVTPESAFPVDRAKVMVAEMQAALGWMTVRDPALRQVVEGLAADIPASSEEAAWAVALEHHVLAARKHEERLRRMSAFDIAILDEAPRLVAAYEKGGAKARRALEERLAALIVVLREKLRVLRAAADYVFRAWPAIALEARSERMLRQQEAAQRTRRRNQRAAAEARKAAESKPAEPQPAESKPADPQP